MSPGTATVLSGLCILACVLLDRDRDSRVSPALWIPLAWISIAASRMVSQWLGGATSMESPEDYLDGSPLDRLILSALLAAGLMVLLARGRRTGTFLRANGPILLFFLYCALSLLWSDYPWVAFKRWVKAVGDVVMVLIVLTDPDPSAAVKRLLARAGFVLIPLSVLLIKYYPDLGRSYSPYTGTQLFVGVTTTKNGLGYVCLIFGLASLWRILHAFRDGERSRGIRVVIAHGTVLAMALWLLGMADSATSLACFIMGGGLIWVARWPVLARRPTVIPHLAGAGAVLGSFVLFVVLGAGLNLVEAMGRDPTLTGRTIIWEQLLSVAGDPVFGTGFESFWLGDRAQAFWEEYLWRPNQAHNGYLEIFLNLGWTGVTLLGIIMVWGYRNVVNAFHYDPEDGRLRLAYLVIALVYNVTEAAFKMTHPVWIAFLLAVTVIPEPPRRGDA